MKEAVRNQASANSSRLSAAQFAAEPRTFIQDLASSMNLKVDEPTIEKLSDRIANGASRQSVMLSLLNIQGERYPLDEATAALHFARAGTPGSALVLENILSFAPHDPKAFVLNAFSQILVRHPSQVELARHVHFLEVGRITRLALLESLNEKAISEGRVVQWDSARLSLSAGESSEGGEGKLVFANGGFRSLSSSSSEILTLCRFTGERWELAPSMIARADEIRSQSWLVSDGFILTGPKAHLDEGAWLLELDIIQSQSARLVVDVVANGGIDRLLHTTVLGNLKGSFVFDKLRTHAFLEVRLRVEDAALGQWISLENVSLKRLG